MDDYLAKPVVIDKLRLLLAHWLSGAEEAVAEGTASSAMAEIQTQQPTLDMQAAEDLYRLVGSEFAEILQIFIDETPGLIDQLREAVAAGDIQGAMHTAHRMKSSSASLGARQFPRCANASRARRVAA